jgi:hypothetical protein
VALAPVRVFSLQVRAFEHSAKISEVTFTKSVAIFDGTAIYVSKSTVSGCEFVSVGSLIGRESEYIHSQFCGRKDGDVPCRDIFVGNLWQNRNWLCITIVP